MNQRKTVGLIFWMFFMINMATDSLAWDGERKGFILGLGIGPAHMSVQRAARPGIAPKDLEFNKATRGGIGKIGYAFTNQWAIYMSTPIAIPEDADELECGIAALAFSYYHRAEPKSIYYSAGIGLVKFGCSRSSRSFEVDPSSNLSEGLGVFAGVGYEFAKHWSVEGNVMQIRTTRIDTWPQSTDTDVLLFMVTINVLGY